MRRGEVYTAIEDILDTTSDRTQLHRAPRLEDLILILNVMRS